MQDINEAEILQTSVLAPGKIIDDEDRQAQIPTSYTRRTNALLKIPETM